MGLIAEVGNGFTSGYESLINTLPTEYASLMNLLIFSILISLYAIFTWKFYRSLSKKDLLELDLSRYNRSTHPFIKKVIASFLYLIEYIIILPFLIFFWLSVLAIIILILSQEQTAQQILLVSASIVAAIRILAYYQEELSRDLAKMFPFTILTIFLLTPNFFSFPRIVEGLFQVKDFLSSLVFFLAFIIFLELILRTIDTISNLFHGKDEDETLETDSQTT